MVAPRGPGEEGETSYVYDALDRRDLKREPGPLGTDQVFEYGYVGLSERLAREEDSGNTRTKSYDYDSQLRRLGQETTTVGLLPEFRSYAFDANGSVEGLEHEDGRFTEPGQDKPDRYRYDPYGELDVEVPEGEEMEDQLGPAAAENPFRFEGFYYDAAIKTYDMQARPYRPDIGRFTTQDRFQSASGDYNLQSDPLTNNRYAFAGGNPVNRIEFDGHDPCYGDFQRAGCKGGLVTDKKGIQTGGGAAEKCNCPRTGTGFNAFSSPTAAMAASASTFLAAPAPAPPVTAAPALAPLSLFDFSGERVSQVPGLQALEGGDDGVFGSIVHGALDVGGLLPVVGEPLDLANCGIYAAEGNKTDAGLACAAAIPIAGYGASAAKAGRRLQTAADAPKGAGDLAGAAPKALGPGATLGSKIQKQLPHRGWTERLVRSTIDNPTRTVPWRDTRNLRGGGRMDDPATGYYGRRGGYVVRNDRTGDIVQVSNRTDPGWRAPWDQ